MMGLGSFVYGGSSSSSNLSALAPPFTVDRFVPKSGSKSIGHFAEAPYPRATFDSSPQSWPYSQNNPPVPQFSPDPELEIETLLPTQQPSPYRFSGSQSVHSPTTVLPTLNSNPIPITDAFSYDRYSDSSMTSLAQTDPYYARYVPPAVHDNSPLLPLDEPVYDVLPTSSVASLSGSYLEDYTQSLSGLEYPAAWGHSFLNGLGDGERSKQPGFDESFGQKKGNVAASPIYNSYPKQAATEVSCSPGKPHTIFESICTDILGQQAFFGSLTTDRLHDKDLRQNSPNDSSKMSVSESTTITSETLSDPLSLESISNYLDHQKPYGALHENVFSSKNLKFAGHVFVEPREEFSGCNQSNQKEPDHKVGWKGSEVCLEDRGQIVLEMEQNCPVFLKSYAMGKKEISNKSPIITVDADIQVPKARPVHLGPHMNGSYDTEISGRAEVVDSAEKLYESLDHCGPAVDSPCWKGAPASCFSSFDVSEDTPLLLMKKLEASNYFTVKEPSVFPLNTDDSVKVSSQKFSERTSHHVEEYSQNGSSPSLKMPLVANPSCKVRISEDATKDEPRKEYAVHQKFHLKPEENRNAREIKVPSGNGLIGGKSVHNVSEKGSMQFNATEYASCPLSSGEDVSVKLADPCKGKLAHTVNVQTLVGAMHNLSEVLLLHCSNHSFALKERDLESLMDVLNNLEACMVKVEHLSSREESLISQDLTAGQPIPMKEAAASDEAQHVRDEKNENTDVNKDDRMTKAMKKVLQENFQDGKETHSESLLYKNLWLEAEAALCSFSLRARYDRVKMEMGIDGLQKVKDVSENPAAVDLDSLENPVSGEKLLSPKFCHHDAKVVGTSASEVKDSKIPDISIQQSPVSSSIIHGDDDVDTSVMARFLILKCRGENLNSMNEGSGQLSAETDNHEFSGKNECLDSAMEHDLQYCNAANHTEDERGLGIHGSPRDAMKEVSARVPGYGLVQSSASVRLGEHLQAGWYDSSSSEWEHVLKEEVAWQN